MVVTQSAAKAPTLSLNHSSWSPAGGWDSYEIRVTTNQPRWTAWSDQAWLSVEPGAYASTAKLNLAVEPNPSASARVAHVTVIASGPAGEISKIVTVTQGAASVSASRSSWSASASGASTTATVDTNQDEWSASSDVSWLSVAPSSGVDGARVLWQAQVNTGAKRTGTVTLRAGEATRTVTVTQAAASSASVKVSSTKWAAPASAGSTAVTITTNRSGWTAQSDQPWLEVSEPAGVDGRIVTLAVAPNPTSQARTGTVSVTADGASSAVAVTQAAGPAPLEASVSAWSPAATGAQLSLGVTTTSGATWTLSESASWLSVSPTGALASGGTRTLTATANTSSSRRSAIVTVTSGKLTTTIAVVQDTGKPMAVSRTTWAPAASGATVDVSVDVWNEDSWTATSDADWLVAGGPTAPGEDTLPLVAAPNLDPSERTGHVTVTSSSGGTAAITVTQKKG
jgi:hypothetical protein